MEDVSTITPAAAIEEKSNTLELVAPGVFRLKVLFVNVYIIKNKSKWAIIDAGLWGAAPYIIRAAEEQFGEYIRPEAIFLTHGHFDHIGAINNLLPHWPVPVYAHPLEFPYLTGRSDYPPADPTVGGGAMAMMSWMFPNNSIDIREHLEAYPADGSLPGFPEWKVLFTPGHAPGHVSFYRERDKTLIAGDAFVTVKQESASAVMKQIMEVHGPPTYFTCDWISARESVEKLAALNPAIAACGHGTPMKGERLQTELSDLTLLFQEKAVPKSGRYVSKPAITDENGVIELPPPTAMENVTKYVGLGLAVAAVGLMIWKKLNPDKNLASLTRGKYLN